MKKMKKQWQNLGEVAAETQLHNHTGECTLRMAINKEIAAHDEKKKKLAGSAQ